MTTTARYTQDTFLHMSLTTSLTAGLQHSLGTDYSCTVAAKPAMQITHVEAPSYTCLLGAVYTARPSHTTKRAKLAGFKPAFSCLDPHLRADIPVAGTLSAFIICVTMTAFLRLALAMVWALAAGTISISISLSRSLCHGIKWWLAA